MNIFEINQMTMFDTVEVTHGDESTHQLFGLFQDLSAHCFGCQAQIQLSSLH